MENNVVFICPSWEERSWLGFKQECTDLPVKNVVLVMKESPKNGQGVEECKNKITQFCSERSIKYNVLKWIESPAENWLSLKSQLDTLLAVDDLIHLDISTMPRDIIWTLLFFLYHCQNRVIIRYYQPNTYSDSWLCREPYSPRLLLKHSGIIEFGKPLCLVMVTGFDVERTRQIVSKFEPQKVVLCSQKGQQFDNANRNASNRHENICRGVGVSDVTTIEIDCYGDDFGKKKIEEVILSLSDYNIILASFGPKPSAIGIYLAYQLHPEVALCYVPCKEYNKDYCHGIGSLYTIDYKV